MPEGPEATYLAKYIYQNFGNKTLKNIVIHKGRYKTHGPPENFHEFKRDLSLTLSRVQKKGKVLFLHFTKGSRPEVVLTRFPSRVPFVWTIVVKLGMVGWFFTREDRPPIMNSHNITFEFENKDLFFTDFRSFGTLLFTRNPDVIDEEMENLAPDIMNTRFVSVAKRIEAFRTKPNIQNMRIEDALVEQTLFVSGIGNIIKSEVLYDSRILPTTKVKELSIQDWMRLFASSKKIAHKIADHLDKKGFDIEGYYNLHQVYRKQFDKYGNKVRVRNANNDRKTYWVPEIQNA